MTAQLETLSLRKPQARSAPIPPPRTLPQLPDEAPDGVANIATTLAVACIEILQGRRSASTLARWATPELIERIRTFAGVKAELARTRRAPLSRIQAGTTRVCHVNVSTVEATVNIKATDRNRAVALRLKSLGGRWSMTDLVVI